eukprot:7342138-Heterocapsa_arctica.AAC.1
MDLQLQEGPRFGIIPGHPQLPGEWDPEKNDREEPAKTTETDAELPSENMEKSKMAEEGMKKIAEIVSENEKTYLLKIEARLEGIEHSITASKEMTE